VVSRGDVWLVALDPTIGVEIQKTRPCVVISPAELNDHMRTVIVAPMTTGNRPAAFRVPVTFQGKTGLILVDQVRSVDKQRLVQRKGALTNETLRKTLSVLRHAFEE
jgi:mRNA interferase MazF